MICKTMKKTLLGLGIGAGVLGLLFGDDAFSYLKTGFNQMRQSVRESVPVDVEIARLRQMLDDLDPVIAQAQQDVARAEVEVETLVADLNQDRDRMERLGREVVALRDQLESGEVYTVSDMTFDTEDVEKSLERRFNAYKTIKTTIERKEETLNARRQAFEAGKTQLREMAAKREELNNEIERLAAEYEQIKATEQTNTIEIDDGPLASIQEEINQLDQRLEVRGKLAEDSNRYLDDVPVRLEEDEQVDQDLMEEIDAEFGGTTQDVPAGRQG